MDKEFNSTPFSSTRIFNFGLDSPIIEVQMSFVSSMKLLNLILLFQPVIFILIQLVKSYSIVSTCNN